MKQMMSPGFWDVLRSLVEVNSSKLETCEAGSAINTSKQENNSGGTEVEPMEVSSNDFSLCTSKDEMASMETLVKGLRLSQWSPSSEYISSKDCCSGSLLWGSVAQVH